MKRLAEDKRFQLTAIRETKYFEDQRRAVRLNIINSLREQVKTPDKTCVVASS